MIRLYEPQRDPELIPAVRPVSRRNLFFRRGEQLRLVRVALREADGPCKARWVAEYVLRAKGLPDDASLIAHFVEQTRMSLFRLEKKGHARRIVRKPETWWELAVIGA